MNDSMQPDERDDERLAGLLASVQAEANPAVWARVRTRLAAAATPARSTPATRLDAFLDWLTRPAAMAAATAAVVVALGAGWTVLGSLESVESAATSAATTEEALVASDATNLMESLLETSSEDLEGADVPEAEGAGDTAAPGDSGGRS